MFLDAAGRKFEGSITLPTVIDLRKLGVDLNRGLPEILQQLQDDPAMLANVLFVVHEESCASHTVDDESFGRLLNGDVLPGAIDSLVDAIINFSQPAVRSSLRTLVQRGKEVEALALLRVQRSLETITAETILASTSSQHAGNTPESAESACTGREA